MVINTPVPTGINQLKEALGDCVVDIEQAAQAQHAIDVNLLTMVHVKPTETVPDAFEAQRSFFSDHLRQRLNFKVRLIFPR
jgi:hypothetical protein